ncbi:MAG: emp24/gp25L/p24 family protein [Lachnospiraceae bacterium]|nr:emp24/gp25L/p24 family protein [Lachnospiraceae bacterium]
MPEAKKQDKLDKLESDIRELEADIEKGKKQCDALREKMSGNKKVLNKINTRLMHLILIYVVLLLVFSVSFFMEAYLISIIVFACLLGGSLFVIMGDLPDRWQREKRRALREEDELSLRLHEKEMETAQLGAKLTKKLEKRQRLML